MGFGQRGYKNYDPRASVIKKSAEKVLNALKLDDPLFTILDFQEPRVIYVISRKGHQDLILQGCIFKSIDGSESQISYSKIQTESYTLI